MRLLYYYGKISQFSGDITDFLSVNFSREFEFVHNGEKFFGGKENKLQLTISTSTKFLPSNFWSEKGKVYNCTLFVGNNAAGKTTILQGIILNEISADIRMGNERLVVVQDDGNIHAIAFRRVVNGGNAESEIYYSVLAPSVDDNSINDKQPIILKKVQKQLILSDIFKVTRIAYFSNTFSENDLLNYISLPFEFFKEDGQRSSKCIKNYSTAAKVESLVTNETNYDIKKQFQLFWNSRYKEEAVFALSDIAKNSVGDDFKKNLPEMIYISKIDLIYELGDVWKSKTYEVEDVIYGVSNREGNSRDKKVAYLISASCILRLVKNVDTAIALELLTKYIEELRKQENMNRGYFEIISDLVYVLFTSVAYEKDAKSISLIYKGNYESLSSLISETINNTNSEDDYKTLLKRIQNAYDFGYYLSELDLSSKFSIFFIPPEPTYARYSNVNWEARAKIEDFSDDNRKEFIELVEKYETTLQYSTKKSNRPYLSFSWGLSSGQENMLDMLASLYRLRSNSDGNTIKTLQIFLDEADIGYHPEWQREWFYYFPQIVEDIFKDTEVKDIQFILATHSPLLLGDIPSRCAKYVQCSKEGKTTINERLYDEEGEVETFGQNYYTILRNGFFLEKGAIGEIAIKKSEEIAEAFEKLRKLKKDLNTKERIEKEIENDLLEIERKINSEISSRLQMNLDLEETEKKINSEILSKLQNNLSFKEKTEKEIINDLEVIEKRLNLKILSKLQKTLDNDKKNEIEGCLKEAERKINSEILKKLKEDLDNEANIIKEINVNLIDIKNENTKALGVINKDSIEFFNVSENVKTIKTKSGMDIKIECGAYLHYIDMLINLYSGFIKERLKKEFMEIILYFYKDGITRVIEAIDEKIERLKKLRKGLE